MNRGLASAVMKRVRQGVSVLLLVMSLFLCAGCSIAGRRHDADAEMNLLMDKWERSDGDARFEAADRLSEFMIAEPETFLRRFESRPEAFQSWLDSLGGTSLRDFGDSFARRVALRQQMLDALERVSLPELQMAKARALKTIRDTPVTSVN